MAVFLGKTCTHFKGWYNYNSSVSGCMWLEWYMNYHNLVFLSAHVLIRWSIITRLEVVRIFLRKDLKLLRPRPDPPWYKWTKTFHQPWFILKHSIDPRSQSISCPCCVLCHAVGLYVTTGEGVIKPTSELVFNLLVQRCYNYSSWKTIGFNLPLQRCHQYSDWTTLRIQLTCADMSSTFWLDDLKD